MYQIGDLKESLNENTPEGWIIGKGQKLSIIGNENLYDFFGDKYNNVDEEIGFFRLPDLTGKVSICNQQGRNTVGSIVNGFTGSTELTAIVVNKLIYRGE